MSLTSTDVVDTVYMLESIWIVESELLLVSLLVIFPDNVSVEVLDLMIEAVP